jgi:hypothetical protein
MTCIVGLVHEGKVYMGGDSEAASDWSRHSVAEPKVFRLQDFLVGYTTSFRFGQLLQYQLVVRERHVNETDMQYLVTGFVDDVRKLMKDNGYAEVENNQESGGEALIGYRGKLYKLQNDYSLIRSTHPFYAVGIGYPFALGALAVLPETLLPTERVTRALEAAASFANHVRAPFHILSEAS